MREKSRDRGIPGRMWDVSRSLGGGKRAREEPLSVHMKPVSDTVCFTRLGGSLRPGH